MNDREYLLTLQQEQQQERNAVTQVEHYEALGIGLAAFCVAMYTALAADKTLTRAESLRLVESAVRGR